LLVAVFIYTYFPRKQKENAIQAINFKIESIVDMMSIGVGIGMGEIDMVAIGEVLSWAKKDSSLAYIVVLNQDTVQVSSYINKQAKVNVAELLKAPESLTDNRVLHYKRQLIYQKQVLGTLLIGYSLQSLDTDIARQKETILYICLAIFGFGLIISIVISTGITRTITRLSKGVNAMAEGNTPIQVAITSDDEIGKLARAFNDMIVKVNQSREALLASHQYTENILMSMIDSLLVLDQSHTIVRANRAAYQLLECTDYEVTGKQIDHFLDKKDAFADSFLPILQQYGQVQNLEGMIRTQAGNRIHVLFSAAIIRDRQGAFQGIVCVAQNISERKKAEAQLKEYFLKLEKSNQDLEKFNYVVSHDLKAPLHGVFKLTEWITEDTENNLSEESRANFDLLKGRVLRMEGLINGLLEYYKTGRLIKLPELVNVDQLVAEVVQHLSPPSHFCITIQPHMPTFFTQRSRLQNVFMHLISNAIRFNDKKEGRIAISVLEQETYYQFSIEDNGSGIAPEFYDRIFVIFQTLQARDKVESTGIGLTIAKRIVEEHHGTISVDSVVGQGSVFSFTWPKES
jgi:PAS domain S-box-containing protein